MLCCQYPEKSPKHVQPTKRSYEQALPQDRELPTWYQKPLIASPGHLVSQPGVTSSPTSDTMTEESSHSATESVTRKPLGLTTGLIASLDSVESELLDHYISHTARAVAFDADDLYALKVGIPSLAHHSRPLVSSMIALAAVCKCKDMIRDFSMPMRDNHLLYELLALADRHHKASLRQTQDDMACIDHYDFVLANAPLMVLYASANHSVRIQLSMETVKTNGRHVGFAPAAESQWIPLIRAAHLAFTGLRSASRPGPDMKPSLAGSPLAVYPSLSSWRHLTGDNVAASAEDGPTREARDVLLPTVASTSVAALEKLREWAQTMISKQNGEASHGSAIGRLGGIEMLLAGNDTTDLQACFEALDILGRLVNDVFSRKASQFSPKGTETEPTLEVCPQSLLSEVSPWLRTYLASVTSDIQTDQPLRRTIMFFLNRVPAQYLDLVQTTLGVISEQGEGISFDSLSQSITHRLAMAIFAHWLVMVMLLNGVWWIGDIGAWELERVISFMQYRSSPSTVIVDEEWWPKSMLNIAQQIKCQRAQECEPYN